jgi:hypothetical protein
MARTQLEATEKVKVIASTQRGHRYIRIMGFGHAKEEWVNEEAPLVTDENFYTRSVKAVFNRIKERNLTASDIYKGQEKQKYSFE